MWWYYTSTLSAVTFLWGVTDFISRYCYSYWITSFLIWSLLWNENGYSSFLLAIIGTVCLSLHLTLSLYIWIHFQSAFLETLHNKVVFLMYSDNFPINCYSYPTKKVIIPTVRLKPPHWWLSVNFRLLFFLFFPSLHFLLTSTPHDLVWTKHFMITFCSLC